jgi:hypothetical protein
MVFLNCSRVFFELLRCCFQASQPVYTLLQMCQQALDEHFTLPLALSQTISWHTSMFPNSISPHDNDSSYCIPLMNRVVPVFKDPYG